MKPETLIVTCQPEDIIGMLAHKEAAISYEHGGLITSHYGRFRYVTIGIILTSLVLLFRNHDVQNLTAILLIFSFLLALVLPALRKFKETSEEIQKYVNPEAWHRQKFALTISDEGIVSKSENSEVKINWIAITSMSSDNERIVLCAGMGLDIIIPNASGLSLRRSEWIRKKLYQQEELRLNR